MDDATLQHRISAGAIVRDGERLLLVRHVREGRYDFWVCPGGGVQGHETLEAAAQREVREETGLEVEIGPLAYIEEFAHPGARFVKFWFLARPLGGRLDTSHPDTVREHIVQAAWLTLAELGDRTVFPTALRERFAQDAAAGFPGVVRLPLRPMAVW